ncbi:dual specificity protein phosphatase family protein [Polaribacter sp. Asnod6-C07]|uniref:dual specificity protein phosphatase family protein n=1 Tax=Polaribacter sp. Asnod6-C07 TaxID=3160582 RepID=UPI003867C7A5
MKKYLLCIACCISMLQITQAQVNKYQKVTSKNFNNFYKISDDLYRAEQPSKKGFKELEALGIKTILNLRRLRNDNNKAKATNLKLEHIAIKTKILDEDDIIKSLKIIKNEEQPVLVHCWHGSDRTGTIVAAYRMVIQNWSKEDAIAEFRYKPFGYHEKMYPNLLVLLQNLNVKEIQQQLKIKPSN